MDACRDAVMLQHRYELAAQGPVAFAVVDSLLLAHQLDSGAVHIFDVVANASRALAPPAPLSLLQPGVRLRRPPTARALLTSISSSPSSAYSRMSKLRPEQQPCCCRPGWPRC